MHASAAEGRGAQRIYDHPGRWAPLTADRRPACGQARSPVLLAYLWAASAFIFFPSDSVYQPAFTSSSTDLSNLLW